MGREGFARKSTIASIQQREAQVVPRRGGRTIVDGDLDVEKPRDWKTHAATMDGTRRVAPAARPSESFDDGVDEVHDPILADLRCA